MKSILTLAVFLSLFCASFAAADATYESKGLRISRSIENVKIAAISTTTGAAQYSTRGAITLIVKNIGATEKKNITIAEDLFYVPSGLKLAFSKAPSLAGTAATWSIGALPPSSQFTIVINASGAINEASLKSLASPSVSYTPLFATLSAPSSAKVGESVRLSLISDGSPLANATILVSGPASERFLLQTDSAGQAAYIAGSSGFYTYSSDDFETNELLSTQIIKPIVQAPAAGALLPKEQEQPMDLLPFALGLAMLAAIAIALFTLFGSRSPENEAAFPPSSGSTPPSAPSSPQTQRSGEIAAGQGMQTRLQAPSSMPEGGNSTLPLHEEKKMQEVLAQEASAQHAKAKSIYEKRKEELEQRQAELLKKASAQKAKLSAAKAPQKAAPKKRNELLSRAYAASAGEHTKEDDSIEKTIAELERIRTKLKKKNAK